MRYAIIRAPNVVGVRFHTRWIRLPPSRRGVIAADT